jgi:hypothetical protein
MASIKLTWAEYQAAALAGLRLKYPNLTGDVTFRKLYAHEPEGDYYEYPDFVLAELEEIKD